MKKSCKILLIIAGILIGTGVVFCVLGFVFGGGDSMGVVSKKCTQKSATFDEVEVIEVLETSNDVKIIKSSTDSVKVTYSVCENFGYKLSNSEGRLKIEFDDYRKWYEYLRFIGSNIPDLVIEVPDKTLKELNVKTSSGDIEALTLNSLATNLKSYSGKIEISGSVGELDVSTSSGSVQLNHKVSGENANISATSGAVKITGDFKGNLNAKLTSGRLHLSGVYAKEATLENTSGSIYAEGLTAATIHTSVTSGSVTFYDVHSVYDMNITSVSGSLNLEKTISDNYNLQTTSGSIKAIINEPKIYDVSSVSGRIRTPEQDVNAKGLLIARTTSGSIKIELAK